MAPWLLGFFAWTLGPMVFSAGLVFTEWELLTPIRWIGTANFTALAGDGLFARSLYNTAYFTFLAVPLQLTVALLAAMVLNLPIRGVGFYRAVFYVPSITPQVASVILWVWIFNPEYGLANAVVQAVGLPRQLWMLDPELVKPVFIFMSLWGVGNQMVIFLAGLQGVPESLIEAAQLDGASAWQRVRHITLPMISPVIFFNLIIGIIGSFQVFTTAFLATGGGPNYASLFYVLYLYQSAFQFLRMGYASALAWILFAIIMAFTLLQFRFADRWVYYEGTLRR
ncbi:MAG: sugar ABC transporter permease [Chloroflexi bacterium]|nr:sugar ABC transporter permease [Chloroflexota bacterium]